MFHFILFINFLFISLFWFGDSTKVPHELIVNLVKPNGKIRGHILKSSQGKDFYAFQDIPFAAPPIGKRRFKAPQYHDGWDGILNVTDNKKICIQFHPSRSEPLEGETEDCLVLNVYSPAKPGSKSSLPVLFWVHGGGYFEGSARIENYNPSYFIDENIIVVTINYRLGPLGFLSTGDDVIPGNMGLKDQHLALAWTAENIHLFGGDAEKIVIAAHSAGAYAIGFQVLSERNRGLFRGVIQQSGSPLVDTGFQTDPKQYAVQLIQKLDQTGIFDPKNSTRHVEILQNAPIDEIRRVTKTIVGRESQNGFMPFMIWAPVMENKQSNEAIVTAPMRQAFQEGDFNLVPTLMGIASEEALYFLPDPSFDESAQRYDKDSGLLIHPRLNIKYEDTKMVGSLLKAVYTSSTFFEDKYAFVKFTSDVVFSRAVIEQAQLMARYVPVYLYQFCLRQSGNYSHPGAPHTSELPYIWYNGKVESNLEEDGRIQMIRMWTNFIKYLNPTPEKDFLLQNIEWPRLDSTTMEYLNINKTLSIETNPRNYNEMRKILNVYVQQPYNVY
ncbi:unnamed protein product [Phaedon cochleariae]|uniref:Carboxylesterase type B domain-containing protein n=1 Tax=Phaedon cochleariae TaxID=80249 RepID=A0A9N9X4P7_PHACE|nr:unnamed protein product [Phaedon cochleariae]